MTSSRLTKGKNGPTPAPFIITAAVLTLALAAIVAVEVRTPRPSRQPAIAVPIVPPPYAGPRFTEVASESGLVLAQTDMNRLKECNDRKDSCVAKLMSGGGAAGDYDNDGHADLFVTRVYGQGVVYRNMGNGRFEDRTSETGIKTPADTNGAAWADVDNDGDQDLYVTTIDGPQFYLYINDGNGIFTEEAASRGAALSGNDGKRAGYSIAIGDYDNDGWIDIYTTQWGRDMFASYTRLLRNLGNDRPGHFEDATTKAGFFPINDLSAEEDIATHEGIASSLNRGRYTGKYAFAPAFADFDGDGWQDLAVAADFHSSRLFWNNGDGTFTDGTDAARVGTDENGMGAAVGDVDGDGRNDWFVTSIYQMQGRQRPCVVGLCMEGTTGNRLYRYAGNRMFEDATDAFGLRDGSWGWGSALFDHDNDGDLDAVMTNGMTEMEPFEDDAMRFWTQDGKGERMTERAAETGIDGDGPGKGLLVFDYDDDGDLDVFVADQGEPPKLYRNDGGNRSGWLRVVTRGTASNKDGIGAVVSVTRAPGEKPIVREIGTGTHFLGQSEKTAHFGLGRGSSAVAEVRIRWPKSGKEQILTDIPRNTTLTVIEPQ